jgi:predicted alpha/beta-hydrolase family hydrolase
MNLPPAERLFDSKLNPPVLGFLHRPAVPQRDALVLTHGAGANCQVPHLIALAEAFASAGFLVLRCDLPFRQQSPHGPPPFGSAERDREGLRNAVTLIRNLVSDRVFLGGHSYGGRQSTMLAASDPSLVTGLLLMSYPLHPPHKPDQLRTQHFPNLRTPALFVHGTRDPFGSETEMRKALKLILASTRLLEIEGAGHDLKVAAKQKTGNSEPLATRVIREFQEFFGKP